MAAAIVGTSEMAAVEMGLGIFNQSIVDTHIGKLMATGAGEEAILVTMLRNEADMGLIHLSVDRAAQSTAADLMSVTWESSSIVSSRRPQRSVTRAPPRPRGSRRSTGRPGPR